ncbi:hypothetical protein HYC85_010120 [Camellia sinensis]|uniref:Peptidase M24 domain-containing protein n=1 Tax=Camellia sinensis TaxID=4442 RepID=A0A7J7HJT3_CAMSI|nr:hypothetical protein HYC85_010120 [Camellia sinensis]
MDGSLDFYLLLVSLTPYFVVAVSHIFLILVNGHADKMRKGLKEIGILKDDRHHSYNQLNPTNIGHYLGMDVHDCSTISYDRPLKPGVVITIEPGVYIPVGFSCPDRYQGIGIRIEDEVLITESGYEV